MVLTNSHINPPAPKVPRRGSLAVDATGRICQTGTASAGGGRHVRPGPRLVLCTFCRSAQNRPNGPFRSNMAATLARLGVNFGQQGPNFGPTRTNWLQLRPNLAPRWHNLAATWTHLGATSNPSWKSIWLQNGGHSRPDPKSSNRPVFTFIFGIFLISMTLRLKQCSACCVSVGPKLVWSCRQRCPSCGVLELTWTSACITWLQIGIHLCCFGPNLKPRAKLGSTQANFADSMRHAQILTAISNLMWLWWGSCGAMLPTLGLSWAQLRRQMRPHRTKLRMLSPACVQTRPSCAMLDPS